MFFSENNRTINGKYGNFLEAENMKKVFAASLFLCMTFCVMPVLGCKQETTGIITGGACSIKELNKLEENKNIQKRFKSELNGERDLRPVRAKSETEIFEVSDGCLFVPCLYKIIFKF